MRAILALALAALVTSSVAAQPHRLLPTSREAARVRALQRALDNSPTGDVPGACNQVKAIVQDFIIRHLDAAPAISDAALREQLWKVIGPTPADTPEGPPYVRSDTGWGPGSTERLWAIAYAVCLEVHGPGDTGVVIDSYVWDRGRTRLAGRQDSDYSRYGLNLDWLASVPDNISLLVHAGLQGSNGLGNWKVTVYSCDKNGVHRTWQLSDLHGLTAVGRDELITLRHARPCEGAASTACAWIYEVYVFAPGISTPPTVTL